MAFVDVVIDGSGPYLDRLFTYRIPLSLQDRVLMGYYIVVPWGKATRGGVVYGFRDALPHGLDGDQVRELQAIVGNSPLVDAQAWALVAWLREFYMASWSACLQTVLPGPVLERVRKVAKGTKVRRKTKDSFDELITLTPDEAPVLTKAQQKVWRELQPGLASGATVLLFGVTGSGKTEIYMRACQETLEQGLGVLVLVPEVSLTPQTRSRFVGRFGSRVSILHSGLTQAERREQWWQIRLGKTTLVVGTRSAVFAPLAKLGLIIIDEEHDLSYKQNSDVRYHARQVASWRAKRDGACLVLGSATPCLESYYLAKQGQYSLLTLPERVKKQPMPTLQLVRGVGLPYQVIKALRDTKDAGQQSVILLNRRGFSRYLICQDCGWVPQCPCCSISYTYHRARRALVCHYCGTSQLAPDLCLECGSSRIDLPGQGTEKVESELAASLPDLRVARLDRDTMGAQVSKFEEIYSAFAERKLDTLLGTQMVSKGLDFPLVSLVVVLEADTGLNLPDFRASERTYSLLTQVAGRAGRGQVPGRVILVCSRPEHNVFQDLLAGEYEQFMQEELSSRRETRYPPFCRMLRILVTDVNVKRVETTATELGSLLREASASLGDTVDVLGPSPCPIEKLQNRYRWHILLKALKVQDLHSIARKALCLSQSKGSRIVLDQDPLELM